MAEDVTLLRAREGAAALMRGQYDKAIASYDEALSAPEIADFIEASIYSDRGVAKWRLNQTKEAIDDFNKSIELSPENAPPTTIAAMPAWRSANTISPFRTSARRWS